MAYSKNWKLADVFTIAQAGYLWEERDPPINYDQEAVRGERPSDVAAVIQALEAAVQLNEISAENTNSLIKDCFHVSIRREQLVKFAKAKKRFPSFLFDTLADDAEVNTDIDRAKNRGGRPAKYDWDGCTAEIVRIADVDSLPNVQNKLVKRIQEWFRQTYDQEPAESEIKRRVSFIYNSLKDRGWEPKDG